ncbi:oxidoreductase C-terminal domain-containing protein [Streptomyces sp. NPDC020141]|uniref:oxidoreductase C-terminal domain-containing protein n=1 Tax=Streptomyces sp. NPDC020141 TaxID=3365065 RepID=UPI00378F7911
MVLGDGPGAFSVLLFGGAALRAVESVNRPGDHLAARRLLAAGVRVSPAEAASEGFSLRARSLDRGGGAPPGPSGG